MHDSIDRRTFLARATGMTAATAGGLAAGLHVSSRALAADDGKWGDLVGRLVYDGPPPTREPLTVDKDVECCGKFDIRDESLMVGSGGGLANVYIYVRSRRVEVCQELEETVDELVLLDNRDCIFMPHCLTIWYPRQKLHIVNSDPVAQNVAFSPLGDLPANIVLPPPPDAAAEATWTFRRRQSKPVPIACNYHPWESAYILPLDTPYATVTAADGTFRIPKLPVGELEFQVWHERVGYLETPRWQRGRFEVTISPGVTELGTITIAPTWLESA